MKRITLVITFTQKFKDIFARTILVYPTVTIWVAWTLIMLFLNKILVFYFKKKKFENKKLSEEVLDAVSNENVTKKAQSKQIDASNRIKKKFENTAKKEANLRLNFNFLGKFVSLFFVQFFQKLKITKFTRKI